MKGETNAKSHKDPMKLFSFYYRSSHKKKPRKGRGHKEKYNPSN